MLIKTIFVECDDSFIKFDGKITVTVLKYFTNIKIHIIELNNSVLIKNVFIPRNNIS